jgi:hypothetical protein
MKYIFLLFSLFSFSLLAGDKHINEPYLKEIFLIGNTAIKLSFSEKMSEVGLLKISNYSLVGNQRLDRENHPTRILNISSVERVVGDNDQTIVLVNFIEPLEYFEAIIVTVKGVKNNYGVKIDPNRNSLIDNSFSPPLLI